MRQNRVRARQPMRESWTATARLFGARLAQSKPLSLIVAVTAMVVGAIAANYPAILSGQVIDRMKDVSSFYVAVPFLAALFGSYLVRELAGMLRKLLVERAACALERDELRRLSSFLLRLDLSAFWGQRIGGLNLRIHRSIEGLVKLLKLLFMDLAPTLMLSAVALAMVAGRSLLVLAVMGGVFLAAMLVTVAQVVTQRGIRMSLFAVKEEVSANLTEVLFGLDYVRAASGMAQEEDRTKALSAKVFTQEFRHHRWMMSFDSAKQLLEGLGLVMVVGIGAWEMVRHVMSGGEVLTLALLYGAGAAPLRDLHRILDEGFENMMKVRELADLYALPSDAGIPGLVPVPPVTDGPLVSADNLGLALVSPEGSADTVLQKVSFDIMPGQWVGLAGASGCGKSTLVKVLLGLAPGYEGSLKVLGVEVTESLKADLWSRIGYVGQSPLIMKGSLRENLLYGVTGDGVSDATLLSAIRKAGLAHRFAGGLDEPIEELGRNLSGGERQRLAVARLFLRTPALIVLDEATSALDVENERSLIQELRRHFADTTALVVAHRLEALKATDRILVMRLGELVEQGDFNTLVSLGGEFNRIANLPLLKLAG